MPLWIIFNFLGGFTALWTPLDSSSKVSVIWSPNFWPYLLEFSFCPSLSQLHYIVTYRLLQVVHCPLSLFLLFHQPEVSIILSLPEKNLTYR